MSRPSGTVTFLFTDIQGSTYLWEHHREAMKLAFRRQEEIMRSAMAAHGGYVYKMIGDAFQVAFPNATDALLAALEAQRNLHGENWDVSTGEIKVRMALHTGVTEEREDDYLGPVLNRVARLLSAGHGGQVLTTEAAYQLVREDLPTGITMQYKGEYHLKDLIQPERVYQVIVPDLPTIFPPLRAESTRLGFLAFQSKPFVGREDELAQISNMLRNPDCRLITLFGIGGSGKTRLAVHSAEVSVEFRDGVFFCALEHVNTVQGLILAVSAAVNLDLFAQPGSSINLVGAREQLFQYLADKQQLLVLDNFEQLAYCAELVGDLLDAAPGVKVMLTSRQRLNLPGEWVIEVGGLSYPSSSSKEPLEGFSAVQLFVITAERNSAFHPGPEDWDAILRICQLLEGIPLGLEMAAGWTRTLSCVEIAQEIQLDQDFLMTTLRGMPERQQTLRAVFEYSWRMLSEEEQSIFCRLSMFQDGFSREAAQFVADAPLASISAFVDKALIRRTDSGRFEIHPLLRRYAAEKLSADLPRLVEIRARMADYYTNWLVNMNKKLVGRDHLAGLAAIRGEISNLNISLGWLIEQIDVERLSRILPSWVLFQIMNDRKFEMLEASRYPLELIRNLSPKITAPDSLNAIVLALAYAMMRFFCNEVSDPEEVQSYHLESMRLIKGIPDHNNKVIALLLNCIGPGFLSAREVNEATRECVRMADKVGDAWVSAMSYMLMGDANMFARFAPDDAREAYNQGLKIFKRLGNDWGRGLCLAGLMYLEGQLGNLHESFEYGTTCLEIFTEMGSFERLVSLRHHLAEVSEKLGRFYDASHLYQDNLAYFIRRGDEKAQKYYQNKLSELTGTISI